jgi:nitrite reductase (NO-forming)
MSERQLRDSARTPTARRCSRRPIDPSGPRPSEMLTAFFAAALTMFVAAGLATILLVATGEQRWHWVALHLALLGGVSQLILGAAQFFVCAFLATTPPSRRFVTVHLAVWNAGTVLIAVGVPASSDAALDVGAVLIASGISLLAVSFHAMQRRSLQRARYAVRWYQLSAVCLAVGVLVGALMARGVPWSHGSLIGAHLALNVAGWMGGAIVGTLHTFFPSLTGTQLRFGRLQRPTLLLWFLGTGALALGAAVLSTPLIVVALAQLTAASVLLAGNLVASLRARTIPLTLPARLIALAQVFLPAGLTLALAAALADGAYGPLGTAVRPALAVLLLAGWVGLTVAGSLLHLLAVLARVRHLTLAMPAPQPARDRLITALAGLTVAAWALSRLDWLTGLTTPALALRIAVTVVLAGHIARAAMRVTAPRRGRTA